MRRKRRHGETEVIEAAGGTTEANAIDPDRVPGHDHARVLERYRTLVETVDDGVYAVEPDGRFAMVNEGFAKIHGRSREGLLGAQVSDLLEADVIGRLRALERELRSGEREVGKLEAEIERPDGERVAVETRFSLVEVGTREYARVGVVRDVTHRKRRERALKRQLRRQQVVTELGQLALETGDVDALLSTAVDRIADTLGTDYCKVLELDPAGETLRLRSGVGWAEGVVGEATVGTERDSQAGFTLLVEEPVVVTDLDADDRFAGPDLLVEHGVTSGLSALIGPVDDPWGVLGAHDRARREFTSSDVHFLQSVATTLATAIRRASHERELKKYETIVESVSDGVYTIDTDYRYSMVNGAFAALTGYDRSTLVGGSPHLVVDDEVVEAATTLERELYDGELDSALLESELETATGDRIPVEATFSILSGDGEPDERIGVVRDVTERRRFEETLRGLYETSRDLFRAETIGAVDEGLVDVAVDALGLPGVAVYRHDEEMDRLVPATHSTGGVVVRDELPTLSADEANVVGRVYRRQVAERIDDVGDAPQFGDGVDEHRAALLAPLGEYGVVVVEACEVGAFDARTTQLVELLAANAEVAYDRAVREQAIERQRERSAALNDLNGVVRDINEALTERESREDIEQAVVDRLASSDSYEFAWIGGVDQRRDEVVLRAEAGVEGYLDHLTISLNPAGAEYDGPTSRAIRTGEMQVLDDLAEDAHTDVFRKRTQSYGFHSMAAIPLTFEGTLYGVLDVYAARRNAFGGEEGEVVGQLGRIIGHAINAIDRKQALVSDDVVEVEFLVHDVFESYGVDGFSSGRIEFHRTIPVDDEYLVYGTASDGTIDTLESLCERIPHWGSLSIMANHAEGVRFELTMRAHPSIVEVGRQGGRMHRSEFRNGTFHFVVHLPPSADVRSVVEAVHETHPDAHVIAQRRTNRPVDALTTIEAVFEDRLTEKQRRSLEAAYCSGFFEWPRDSTGEEVAEALGVSPPTFHEHLRIGERALLASVFEKPVEKG